MSEVPSSQRTMGAIWSEPDLEIRLREVQGLESLGLPRRRLRLTLQQAIVSLLVLVALLSPAPVPSS